MNTVDRLASVELACCLAFLPASSLCALQRVARSWQRAAQQPQAWRHITHAFGADDTHYSSWRMPTGAPGRYLELSFTLSEAVDAAAETAASSDSDSDSDGGDSLAWMQSSLALRFLPVHLMDDTPSGESTAASAERFARRPRLGNIKILSGASELTLAQALSLGNSPDVQSLQRLDVSGIWLNAAVLSAALRLPHLQHILVPFDRATPLHFSASALQQAERLTSVALYQCSASVSELDWLAAIPHLQQLSLTTDADVNFGQPKVGPAPLDNELSLWPQKLGLSRLTTFDFDRTDHTRFSPEDLLAFFAGLPLLTELRISNCASAGVFAVLADSDAQPLPALQRVIWRCQPDSRCVSAFSENDANVLLAFFVARPLVSVVIESASGDWFRFPGNCDERDARPWMFKQAPVGRITWLEAHSEGAAVAFQRKRAFCTEDIDREEWIA